MISDMDSLIQTLKDNNLLITSSVTIIYQLCFFSIAWTYKFDKVTDFAGGSNAIVISLLTYFLAETHSTRQLVITLCACLWGTRLSAFLLYRILQTEEDRRFDEIRQYFFKFLGFWIFQMIWVFTICLPVSFTNSPNYTRNITPQFGTLLDLLGLFCFVFGWVAESVSDVQKYKFSKTRKSGLEIIQAGLWKYSRHPNYFGEILLWFGVYLISLSSIFSNASSQIGLFGIFSPSITAFLLLFVSGIILQEPKKEKEFLEANQYQKWINYTNETSPLVPLPNSFYKGLPKFLRTWVLLDLPVFHSVKLGDKAKKSK